MNKKIISLLATVTLTSLAAVHAEETSKQGLKKMVHGIFIKIKSQ